MLWWLSRPSSADSSTIPAPRRWAVLRMCYRHTGRAWRGGLGAVFTKQFTRADERRRAEDSNLYGVAPSGFQGPEHAATSRREQTPAATSPRPASTSA